MNRYTLSAFLGVAVCFIAPGCDSPRQPPQDAMAVVQEESPEKLHVTIWPNTTRADIDYGFVLVLRVVNATAKRLSFRAMNGSWDEHWKISNPRLTYEGWHCAMNCPVTIELEPGEAYERTLNMLIEPGPPLTLISFRMGFTPLDEKQTYWSNKVILGVKPHKGK